MESNKREKAYSNLKKKVFPEVYFYIFYYRLVKIVVVIVIITIVGIELPKFYVWLQLAVACGLGWPAGKLAGHHTDAVPKHSLCYFSSVSE